MKRREASKGLRVDLTAWMRGPNWHGYRFAGYLGYLRIRWVLSEIRAILAANAPLAEGMLVASKDAPNPRVGAVLERMAGHLAEGWTLSASMRQLRRSFPQQAVDLVAAGESVGKPGWGVDQALRNLATFYEDDAGNWSAVYLYPLVLVCFAAVIVTVGTLVVPEFLALTMDLGFVARRFDLPWTQAGPKHYSDAVAHAMVLSVAWAAMSLVFVSYLLVGSQRIVKPFLRRAPGTGGWIRLTELSLTARILGQLLRAGVPLDEALDMAARSDIGRWLRRGLSRTRDGVQQGKTFAESLRAASRRFPRAAQALAAAGEDARDLPGALDYLADVWFERARVRFAILADVFVYVAVAGMGLSALIFTYEVYGSLADFVDWMAQPAW
jgi:MSHA biogenesis protein MshG